MQRPGETLDLVVARGRTSMGTRLLRLRLRSWQIGQCAVAAGVAWFVAHDLIGHPMPFFAPIAAVVGLGTSYGQRLRRVGEVTVGVAVGVFLGDLLSHAIGTGYWQIALIVALSMTTALLLDAGNLLVTQAAVQSVVVSVLSANSQYAFTRWLDAVVGGVVALVAASLVPRAPLRRPREQAALVVDKVADLLRATGDCMDDGDVEHAMDVLADARSTDRFVRELQSAADEGLSVVASSPFRRRHAAGVRRMADLVGPLDNALRNTRVLARRVAIAAYRREPLPEGYPQLVRDLAACADAVADELRAGRLAEAARPGLVALGHASSAVARAHGLSGEVVLAQVRSVIADLLAVSGMDPMEATDAIPPLAET
ncbi:FUSC family protein [Marmoricola endophyticus]|uniref:FUSC family protein n=1 Tax=Marmoricola endophyticus TaxID=2040280 RepID=UPI001E4AA4BD|nr:FUSC family protein [Marmoricola endophyticus]